MKKIWHLAFIDIKIMVRDKIYFFWTLVFPLVFIFLIGSLYKGEATPGKAALMVLNQDKGQWGAYFIRQLESPGIQLEMIRQEPEKYNRILVIPADFSEKIAQKQVQKLVFKKNSDASTEAAAQVETKIIQAIAKVITRLILREGETPGLEDTTPLEKEPAFKNIIEIKSQFPGGTLKKVPSGFDHVIPGVIVQFILMMVLIYGGVAVMLDRQKGVLTRILFSSVSIRELWGGKFLGRLMMGIIQALILIVAGIILFHLNLGNFFLSLLNILVFATFAASLSIFIGSVFNKEDLIVGISVLTANIFSALGGCWWPIEIVPQSIRTIGMISPAYWAMDAFHQIIFFNKGLLDIAVNLLVLLGCAAIFTLLAIKFFRIKN